MYCRYIVVSVLVKCTCASVTNCIKKQTCRENCCFDFRDNISLDAFTLYMYMELCIYTRSFAGVLSCRL